ncbi:MAG TPA: PQQ-dependent sugar dehydrogenase [Nitrososphaera sp.]
MQKKRLVIYIVIAAAAAGLAITFYPSPDTGRNLVQGDMPTLRDDALRVELVVEGLEMPTSMRFLDENNIIVLQKNDGEVRLVSDGELVEEPLLQVDVENLAEQGLLGIAVTPGDPADVYIYLTENAPGDILRNRIYKFAYDPEQRVLADGELFLDLPAEPGPFHNGGKTAIGPDGRLYAAIGDTNAGGGMLDNDASGREPDDKSVVYRIDRETGEGVQDNPFYASENELLHRYYAYGIRNSFGLDFDPVTNQLWMTENGEDEYDEVNLVKPGFNSGWHQLMGPMSRSNVTEDDLVLFEGAHFSDPEFSWLNSIGVTDIEFINSDRLGEKYENNVFVGDINNGKMYFFELNGRRDGFVLEDGLSDLVGDNPGELSAITSATGFGGITDIETGPDGNVYVLSFLDGRIYRITAG